MAITPTQQVLGQDRGFARFVAGEQVALRRYALALTGNGPDADDLLQATLVKLYLVWDRLSDRDHLGLIDAPRGGATGTTPRALRAAVARAPARAAWWHG